MKVDCTQCKNYASVLCRDCIHRIDVADFFKKAKYTTTTSEVNNGHDNSRTV